MAAGVTRRRATATNGSFEHVWTDPAGCCRWLSGSGVVAGIIVTVLSQTSCMLILDVHFDAPPAVDLPGYPEEDVRVAIGGDQRIVSVPVAVFGTDGASTDRRWLHRYPQPAVSELAVQGAVLPSSWEFLFGALCLWEPQDPPHLRWCWEQGLDSYFRIVQRHLWFEEYARRHGGWPVEDAPHGRPPVGSHHPIVSPHLRSNS
jgi:hypothetical protein